MNTDQFIDRAELLWPGKGLTADQRILYRDKMRRFTEREIDEIFEQVSESSKFFPKVADVYDSARACGFLAKKDDYRPHKWTATDCRLCGGSGQIAVFYEQLVNYESGSRELVLRRVMQYESSNATLRVTDFVRYFFRCSCSAGAMETLSRGWPRWDLQKSTTRRFEL